MFHLAVRQVEKVVPSGVVPVSPEILALEPVRYDPDRRWPGRPRDGIRVQATCDVCDGVPLETGDQD